MNFQVIVGKPIGIRCSDIQELEQFINICRMENIFVSDLDFYNYTTNFNSNKSIIFNISLSRTLEFGGLSFYSFKNFLILDFNKVFIGNSLNYNYLCSFKHLFLDKKLYKAKSIYSEEFFESYDIKNEIGLVYLKVNDKWREVEPISVSVNFPYMVDRENNKIFASLDKNYKENKIRIFELDEGVPFEDRNVFIQDSKIFVEALYDENIYCGFDLLNLSFVEKL